MDGESFPQYMRIALDIASRIASGEIEEHQKISGRSVLSSQYNVSPETVRKAINLLSDMKVVEVQEKKGIVILSADNAKRYLQSFDTRREQKDLRSELQEQLGQYVALGKQISATVEKLMNAQMNPLPVDRRLPNYEVKVSPDSDKIGRSIGSLTFWQSTGATVVAIRRGKHVILSPGPYAELYGGDLVVFVGAPESVAAVDQFLNGKALGEDAEA